MKFKHWLYRKGAKPQQSMLQLLLGFVVFIPGAYLLISEYYYHTVWQITGYALVAVGAVIGVNGWLGVMANRIALFINVPGGRFADNDETDSRD